MSEQKVWLITGAGRGLGVDLAKAALSAGHAVVATGRDAAKVSAAVGDHESLITISSTAGITGQMFCTAYAAAKFGIEGWMESLTPEVALFGIRTMLVEPGFLRARPAHHPHHYRQALSCARALDSSR